MEILYFALCTKLLYLSDIVTHYFLDLDFTYKMLTVKNDAVLLK